MSRLSMRSGGARATFGVLAVASVGWLAATTWLRPLRPDPPVPTEGLLPGHRIVAFYGNPRAPRMGVLGSLPTTEMLRRLHEQADAFEKADPSLPVIAALQLVTVSAGDDPGPDGMYRTRMPSSLVEEVAGWTAPDSLLLFLDIQPGRSSFVEEIRPYLDFLARPRIHLALDPEWAVGPDGIPAHEIGSVDADEVNKVVEILADLVDTHDLPPKILVVHRFTEEMLRGYDRIRLDDRVQIVIDMDGFGTPQLKREAYTKFVANQRVQYTGFKLFLGQDTPLMDVSAVLALRPPPVLVIYQ